VDWTLKKIPDSACFAHSSHFVGILIQYGLHPMHLAALLGSTLDANTTLNDNNLLFPLYPSFPSLSAENPGVRLFRLPPFTVNSLKVKFSRNLHP